MAKVGGIAVGGDGGDGRRPRGAGPGLLAGRDRHAYRRVRHPRRCCWNARLAAATDAWSERYRMPSTCLVSTTSGRSVAAGFEELARAGEGPLADELRVTVAEISCGQPLAEALALCGPASRVANSQRSALRSSALGSSDRRWLSSCDASQGRCARTSVARSRTSRPGRAEDPAGGRTGPRSLGAADDRRRPDRQRRFAAQLLGATHTRANSPRMRCTATRSPLRAGGTPPPPWLG